jgi:autotransporter translocation and assembly factor TamB
MKYLKRICLILFICIGVFYVLPVILLQIPAVQRFASRRVAGWLENRIKSKVEIGQIIPGLFNELTLKDVYIEDQNGEELLKARRIAAGFKTVSLLKKRWEFQSCQIVSFNLSLKRETAGAPLNIQHIIDAFAKKDSVKTDAVDINIKDLTLKDGNFSYREKDAVQIAGRKFNPKAFEINDITTEISFRSQKNGELRLSVEKTGLISPSGFQLNDLSFDLLADKSQALIERLTVDLAKSKLSLSNISVIYGDSLGVVKPVKDIYFGMTVNNSKICPADFFPLLPALQHFEDEINLHGNLGGTPDNFKLSDFTAAINNDVAIESEAYFYNCFAQQSENAFVYVGIKKSHIVPDRLIRIINIFNDKKTVLPDFVHQMKSVGYTGEISLSKTGAAAAGKIRAEAGVCTVNIETGEEKSHFISGTVRSDSLNLATLLNDRRFGKTSFDVSINVSQHTDNKLSGLIEGKVNNLRYNGYDYNSIILNGYFSPDSYNGVLTLDSPEGKIDAEGFVRIKETDSEFNFAAKITDFQPHKLHLTDNFKDLSLSLGINADFKGNRADNTFGKISLTDISITTDRGQYFLDSLNIASELHSTDKTLTVESELLKCEMRGNYNFAALASDLKNSIATCLPALFNQEKYNTNGRENTFSIDLTVGDMKDLAETLSLPFALRAQTNIKGYFNSFYNRFNLEAEIPWLTFGGSTLENTYIALNNSENNISLSLNGSTRQKKNGQMPFSIGIDATDNQINTAFGWGMDTAKYHGKILFNTLLSKQTPDAPLNILMQINESGMVFNNANWTLYPTAVGIDQSGIVINRLKAAHNGQFIKIDGAVSDNPEKKLLIELNEVDLEYIFNSLNIQALEFGGIATGFVSIQDLHRTRKLSTRLDVKDFSFNQCVFGDLDLTGTWDDENQGVIMNGIAQKPDSRVDIDGIIYPVTETLSINFDADRADAYFLRKYLDKVAKNLSGNFSGHLRLFGDLNNPTVEGNVFANECRFGIDFLNTYYTFSDSVTCLPDKISIKNVLLHDEKGKTATANGYVQHSLFSDFYFKADVTFDDFMVYNAGKNLNPTFFGTAYGTGTAHLEGTENLINLDIIMRNTENTKMALNFMEEPDIIEYNFIKFVNTRLDTVTVQETAEPASPAAIQDNEQDTEIRMNLLLDANQQAMLDLIMDPYSGDKISGYGNGNLQIQYGTKIPLRVFGTYAIDRGKYNFSLQQAFYRNFDIQEGSTVSFNGDPYQADLNITAAYTVQANLGDLDQQLLDQQQSAKGNIPVNCILKLNGAVEHPAIAFDVSLPNSTDELNRQVKSYIRTEDMLNQQFVYLLVLSRFYTAPEYMSDDSRTSNNMSYLTSTLSSQISNMLGSLSDKFRLGAKYHQSYEGNEQAGSEMEVLLSSQLLDDRLIINGNFGYIDRPYLQDENRSNIPLIGDFDLEYLLRKNGDIRLKFFNHYNYRYLSPRPEMTQGLGVIFRRDFNRFKEFFERKKKK